jgi:MFS transporter, PPP family, 3-phenylpropionic acid transporter
MQNTLKHFSLFYFFYYAALGAYTPYIGRWVDALGFDGYAVGTMLGLWYGSRIIGPPIWNACIERSEKPGHWFFAGSALTLLCFCGFTLTQTKLQLFAVMGMFGFFYNAVMPQFEAMTLAALGTNSKDYGRIRVWGSIGFLIIAGSYGRLLDILGDDTFVWLTIPLLLATMCSAWLHRNDTHHLGERIKVKFISLWQRPGVPTFLIMVQLVQISFGAFYVYFTLHLQAQGHNGTEIGALWAFGVLIEIIMFWFAPSLIKRFGVHFLIIFCLLISVARWIIVALFADHLPLMFLVQSTHAFGFAVFHACCMTRMADYFPAHLNKAGQSLMYGFSSGIGGVLGAVLASLMWGIGKGKMAFFVSAVVSLCACFLYLATRHNSKSLITDVNVGKL